MKNPRISPLIILTLVFAAFTLGFFLGRNYNHTTVQYTASPTPEVQHTSESQTAEQIQSPEQTQESTEPGLININTASASELTALPGIGEVLAQRIVDYREEHGPFASVTDLLNVSGIGEKKLEAILDLITTGG